MAGAGAEPAATRILLVEDSAIDAELIEAQLERIDWRLEIVRARRQEDLERLLRAGASIDLVLCDYSLPYFGGLTALRLIRRHAPDVPVVFISGVVGEDLATEALREGASEYVLKGNLKRLPDAIRRALGEAGERRQRQQAESALIDSEANMRMALDAASLGLWQFSATGEMRWDERCRAMLGVGDEAAADEALLLQRAHRDDRDALAQALRDAFDPARPGVLAHECRFVLDDAAVRWIALRGRRAEGDASRRLTGLMQDMTATRALEQRQRHAELLFRLAAQATDLGIWEAGSDRRYVWLDDGARKLIGTSSETASEVAGITAALDAALHPDDRGNALAALVAAFDETGASDFEHEFRVRRGPGDGVRWLAVQGRRVMRDDGRSRLVGTVRDVTEQRRARELLRESNEELERRVAERTGELRAEIAERSRMEDTLRQMQRLEAVGQLTAGVAHDFNNLLTVVLSNVMLIRRTLAAAPPDPQIARRLDAVRDAATRGATLTRQLLAFARRQRLEPQTVRFNDIVLGMQDLLHTTLGSNVHVETSLATDLWNALADPTQMELVILNLAINARDAMPSGGNLSLRTRNVTLDAAPTRPEEPEPGDYVVLSVSDSGTGMSEEVLSKAFEPFFTTKEVGKGSGLGLPQVFGFAKQSGGGIRIDSRLGRGTTVHVYMPRGPADAADGPAPAPATPRDVDIDLGLPATPPRHLLLVDDDDAVREATAALLRLYGHRVDEAADAEAALQRVRDKPGIALVIADFSMPRMNGLQLRQALALRRPELPVIIVTGYAELQSLASVPEGFLLQKPVGEAQLLGRIAELLAAPAGTRRPPPGATLPYPTGR